MLACTRVVWGELALAWTCRLPEFKKQPLETLLSEPKVTRDSYSLRSLWKCRHQGIIKGKATDCELVWELWLCFFITFVQNVSPNICCSFRYQRGTDNHLGTVLSNERSVSCQLSSLHSVLPNLHPIGVSPEGPLSTSSWGHLAAVLGTACWQRWTPAALQRQQHVLKAWQYRLRWIFAILASCTLSIKHKLHLPDSLGRQCLNVTVAGSILCLRENWLFNRRKD